MAQAHSAVESVNAAQSVVSASALRQREGSLHKTTNFDLLNEAKPSILGLQIFFLAARRDYGDGGDYRARQEL